MIKSEADMVCEIKERMRGGNGQVQLTHLFKPGEFGGQARMIARIRLEPGSSIGLHQHLHEEEIFYIISGEGVISDADEDPGKAVHAGDATITTSGGSHAVRNTGDQPLVMLAVILLTD
jgi:mannose-6-phosphate isomerase-like protein (cupin superfamily)